MATRKETSPGSLTPLERITQSILLIRGHKVMLDADLAALYEVETRVLVQAVKRNLDRKLGCMVDRTHRELTNEDIARIARTYHAWRLSAPACAWPHADRCGDTPAGGEPVGAGLVPAQNVGADPCVCPAEGQPRKSIPIYSDIPGFHKSATLEEIRKHGHVLTPGRYVGAEAVKQKRQRLGKQPRERQGEAVKLEAAIAANLEELGYGG